MKWDMNPAMFVTKMVYWVTMLVNAFLGLEFLLKLFNANVSNDFVNWIYENSQPLLAPFADVFPSARVEGFTVEFATLFAIIVYSLVGFLIMSLVASLSPSKDRK